MSEPLIVKESFSRVRRWKVASLALAVLAAILLICVVALAVRNHRRGLTDERKREIDGGTSGLDVCGDDFNVDRTISDKSIFHDLDEAELESVRDFLLADRGLNLTPFDKATPLDNIIFSIEHYVPDKADAITFLETGTEKPMRRARVIVIHGAEKPPFVREYLVEPIPKPDRWSVLKLKAQADFIPFSARPLTAIEHAYWDIAIRYVTEKVYAILYESFNGYVHHNCTDKCLQVFMQGFPASYGPGARETWICTQLSVEGAILFPLPFEIKLDSAAADPKQWSIKNVRYNGQLFDSVDELVSGYNNGTVKKIKVSPPTKDELLKASSRRRGKPFFEHDRRGPVPTELNGRRFSIKGNMVTYGQWHTEVSVRSTGCVALYNTRFGSRRVAHEISIQEAIALYSGVNPRSASAQYLDAGIGLGNGLHTLNPGTDCPENSVFLDVVMMHDSGSPQRIKNGICVFELNAGIPMRRHYENSFKKEHSTTDGFFYYSGAVDYVLVIRTITTPYNYDYIVDFIFHQNGVIECKTSTAGYLQTAVYEQYEDPFGFRVFKDALGPVHDHMVLYKVDLDVDGTQNTFATLDVVPENEPYRFGDPGEFRVKKKIYERPKLAEKDALIKYNFDHPKALVFRNPSQLGEMGLQRGYRVQPVYMVKQLYPDDYIVTRRAAWSKYQLAVTKYDDLERFGSSLYNLHCGSNPPFDWDVYVNNNESIAEADLVAWVTIGGLHIPVPEDIPTTFTTGNQYTFFLRPFGFFDEDPSMGSHDTMFMIKDDDGKVTYDTYGMPESGKCPVPKRKIAEFT